jgi:hypothetical protein
MFRNAEACAARGRENLHKRYLVHVAGYNLGILMRALGTIRNSVYGLSG